MLFLFEITVAVHRWLWDGELHIWCQLWGLLFFSVLLSTAASCWVAACLYRNVEC